MNNFSVRYVFEAMKILEVFYISLVKMGFIEKNYLHKYVDELIKEMNNG